MKTITHKSNFGDIIVEKYARREFAEIALDAIDCINEYGDDDSSVYVLYKDGREFTCSTACGAEGKFMKTNIVFGCICNPSTYQVFGNYTVSEDGIVNAA